MENEGKLSEPMQRNLNTYLLRLNEIDRPGSVSEILFIEDDSWLFDTVIVEKQVYKNGQWELHLLYVHPEFPLKFIKRKMRSSHMEKQPKVESTQRTATPTTLNLQFFEFSDN